MRLIDAGSARLATTEWTPDVEPLGTVVALHAGVTDRRSWQWCAPAWSAAGWRVLAYDRRGFGDSEWQSEPHDHVADLVGVLDAHDIGDAVLVGNSMGGGVAVDSALAHPSRVRGLVLMAPAVTGQPDPPAGQTTEAERSQDADIAEAEEAEDADRLNRLECRYWLDGTEAPEGRVPDPARSLFLEMNARALTAPDVGEWRQPPSAWDRIAEIALPTLVVVGDLDLRSYMTSGQHLAEKIRGARLAVLDGSAHVPSLDAPERLATLVSEFLGEL